MHVRARLGFGIGNVVVAALLVAAIFVLPVRYWPLDGLLALVATLLVVSGVWLLAQLGGAALAGRVAAFALLGLGLVISTLAVLTLAFLSGVHGRWLDAGLPWTGLSLALLFPYTLVYPVWQLVYFAPGKGEAQA